MIDRRRFILGGVALHINLGWALEPARTPIRVAVLSISKETQATFVNEMERLGWVEGRNITYDRMVVWSEGEAVTRLSDRNALEKEAALFVARNPSVIFASISELAKAALASTRTIPIVVGTANPVREGMAESLAHPGGNVTGVNNIGWELAGKRLQLLQEALPKLSRAGLLMSRQVVWAQDEKRLVDVAAKSTGVSVVPAVIGSVADLPTAFKQFSRARVEAVLASHNTPIYQLRKEIVNLAGAQRLPVVGPRKAFAEAGALFSYGASLFAQYRRAAQMTDSILRGAKPGDMPIEQPTEFELVINLRTAKALALTISKELLLRADEVIQ